MQLHRIPIQVDKEKLELKGMFRHCQNIPRITKLICKKKLNVEIKLENPGVYFWIQVHPLRLKSYPALAGIIT